MKSNQNPLFFQIYSSTLTMYFDRFSLSLSILQIGTFTLVKTNSSLTTTINTKQWKVKRSTTKASIHLQSQRFEGFPAGRCDVWTIKCQTFCHSSPFNGLIFSACLTTFSAQHSAKRIIAMWVDSGPRSWRRRSWNLHLRGQWHCHRFKRQDCVFSFLVCRWNIKE
jgi:hypothetical protein